VKVKPEETFLLGKYAKIKLNIREERTRRKAEFVLVMSGELEAIDTGRCTR
jgi:hypothetical protein